MYINSMGYYVPSERVSNEYFTSVNGLTPEWIEQRTGIKTRSKVGPDENVDTMGIKAPGSMSPRAMMPGIIAGHLELAVGYSSFFGIVMILCVPTLAVTYLVRRTV